MASISTHQINVSDMKCNGCEDTIQDELRHEPGVKRVSANYIEGLVEVETVDGANLDDLVQKINDMGFTASK